MSPKSKQPQKLSVIELALKGISKADIDNTLQLDWEIPPIVQDILGLTNYYIRQWQGSYFGSRLQDGTLYMPEDGITYKVCYKNCTALDASKNDQIRLSFRASLYGNYVIVALTSQPPYSHSDSHRSKEVLNIEDTWKGK